ncbi:MAG TPA: hypothetical protein VMG41_10000 [Gemmatimonadales bacterium]|nr:hypothetical protein [Anaeromyxobacteraceae bacterium]HTS88811.1 hypothetical protein [Gemmatimonadales bacterium]
MRDDGFGTDSEGFDFQQGLAAALPGAAQGAAAGTSVYPGWGTLIGALGGAAMGVAQAAAKPQGRPATSPPPPLRAPAPVAVAPAPAPTAAPAPTPAPATPPPTAPLAGSAGTLSQVLALLQSPQLQAIVGNLAKSSEAGGSIASSPTPAAGGSGESEAENDAISWLVSQRVARLR